MYNILYGEKCIMYSTERELEYYAYVFTVCTKSSTLILGGVWLYIDLPISVHVTKNMNNTTGVLFLL